MWSKISINLCIFLIYLTFLNGISATPPTNSTCKLIKFIGQLDCRNKNLSTIPVLPANTRILDLSNNNIQRIDQGQLDENYLISEIYLVKNRIKFIHYATFQNLNELKILDLSDNLLQNVFIDLPVSLEILYLDRNPLSNDYVLQQRLQFLKFLSMDGANLTKIPNFCHILPALEYLNLENNPSLNIVEDNLKQLGNLKIIFLSPRLFGGRTKSKKCNEFAKLVKAYRIQAKDLICNTEEYFQHGVKSYERTYEHNETWYDLPEAILYSQLEQNNQSPFLSLQNLVSKGLTNFFRFILINRKESQGSSLKIKEPFKLDNYVIQYPQLQLQNVHMTGFPPLNTKKQPEISLSSADGEELKRFQIVHKYPKDQKPLNIFGHFTYFTKVYNFSCEFNGASFEIGRKMTRYHDLRVKPWLIQESLRFEKMECSLNETSDRVTNQVLLDAVNRALSERWIEYAANVAYTSIVESQLKNTSNLFIDVYERKIMRKLTELGINYLKTININHFDVSPPSLLGIMGENELDTNFSNQLYNVKIYNLFNYTNYDSDYLTTEEDGNIRITIKCVIKYPAENSAILAVASKNDPNDVMTFFVNSIETKMTFEIKIINKVKKLRFTDVNVNILENEQKTAALIVHLLKKYLSLELSKEFKRTLTFLMNKIDFYDLNAL